MTRPCPEIQITAVEDGKPGMWLVRVDGAELCRSKTPFFSAARALLDRGYDPNALLRWVDAKTGKTRLTGILGKAAKLTVLEDDRGVVRFAPYRPHPGLRGGPISADQGMAATTLPDDG